ncbi:MAG TPA: polymer-forming cytoskeletal protein [Patescibacteria group bacterium]|nr:polymer-forming cytoskeletal protein [Patescibacteria group bacterium]
MKKLKFLIAFFIIISTFFFFANPVLAQETQEFSNIVVKKGEVIDHDFFAAGSTVTISGVVNGDVFAAGGILVVDGIINGDLLAGAGTINLLGRVSDDVRVGGGTLFVNGEIGKNLTVGGGNINIAEGARIGGSLLGFGGAFDIRGPIGKDVNLFAGQATVTSQINGNLKGSIEKLVLSSEAQILGDLEYESPQKADIDERALIIGKTTFKPSETRKPESFKSWTFKGWKIFNLFWLGFYIKLSAFIIAFLFGLVFLYLFPKRIEAITKILKNRPWPSLGAGFLALILFVPSVILLAISLIGIPLILIFIPVFLFLIYFSKIFTALCLGREVLFRFNSKKSQVWALLIGLLIYYFLRLIPIVSPIIAFGFISAGLGAFLLDQKSLRTSKK